MLVRQIRSDDGTGTLSYLLIDEKDRVGCIVDPNIEDVVRIESMLGEQNVRLTHIVDTHTHADHITGAGILREKTGAQTFMHINTKNKWKVVDQGDAFGIGGTLRANVAIPIDRFVEDGDIVSVGSETFSVLFTPGHTDNHITLFTAGNLLTGDLLLIGQAGRSDLPGGSPEQQYDSLFNKILLFSDETKIHPGHDYQNREFAFLGEERKSNPFLQQRTKAQFVEFVKDFFPPFAETVTSGGKMTLQCGVQRVMQPGENIKGIAPERLHELLMTGVRPFLLDVREPMELIMGGAIEGVHNISINTLKDHLRELPAEKNTQIVCVCQSGGRSLEAAHLLQQHGYMNVLNLRGGTSGWIGAGLPVTRPEKTVA